MGTTLLFVDEVGRYEGGLLPALSACPRFCLAKKVYQCNQRKDSAQKHCKRFKDWYRHLDEPVLVSDQWQRDVIKSENDGGQCGRILPVGASRHFENGAAVTGIALVFYVLLVRAFHVFRKPPIVLSDLAFLPDGYWSLTDPLGRLNMVSIFLTIESTGASERAVLCLLADSALFFVFWSSSTA